MTSQREILSYNTELTDRLRIYQVTVTFGNKTVFFDPKDGKSASSRTLAGVIKLLREREDIGNPELVIDDLTKQAKQVVRRMQSDGFIVPDYTLK